MNVEDYCRRELTDHADVLARRREVAVKPPARQVEALRQPSDVVIGISTSGNSADVIRDLQTARPRGAVTVGWTKGNLRRPRYCRPVCVHARIKEMHILLGYSLCGLLEGMSRSESAT